MIGFFICEGEHILHVSDRFGYQRQRENVVHSHIFVSVLSTFLYGYCSYRPCKWVTDLLKLHYTLKVWNFVNMTDYSSIILRYLSYPWMMKSSSVLVSLKAIFLLHEILATLEACPTMHLDWRPLQGQAQPQHYMSRTWTCTIL